MEETQKSSYKIPHVVCSIVIKSKHIVLQERNIFYTFMK